MCSCACLPSSAQSPVRSAAICGRSEGQKALAPEKSNWHPSRAPATLCPPSRKCIISLFPPCSTFPRPLREMRPSCEMGSPTVLRRRRSGQAPVGSPRISISTSRGQSAQRDQSAARGSQCASPRCAGERGGGCPVAYQCRVERAWRAPKPESDLHIDGSAATVNMAILE